MRYAFRHSLLVIVISFCSLASASEGDWKTYLDAGMAAQQRGDYRGAANNFEAAMQESEKYGRDEKFPALTASALGNAYRQLGRYAEAEPLYRRWLEFTLKAFGPIHWNTALALTNLANIYGDLGRNSEAEPPLKAASAIAEKVFGSEHANVAMTLNNLGSLYKIQGRLAEAEPLFRRSLAIQEKSLGSQHPAVGTSLYNLASLNNLQGRYAEAESLLKRSLAIQEKTLGNEHLDVARSLNELAYLNKLQGRYREAELHFKRSLLILEKALGPEHPIVAAVLNGLGGLYKEEGRYAEAESILKRSVAIGEKGQNTGSTDFSASLKSLGALYEDLGRYTETELLYRRALDIEEKSLGMGHPRVATSLSNLAGLYMAQGRPLESEPLFKRSLAIQEAALGLSHPQAATTLHNLAVLYDSQGRYTETESLYKRSIEILEKTADSESPTLGVILDSLAGLYLSQGRYAQAEIGYKRSLSIKEKAYGLEHPSVATSLNNLGGVYEAQGRSLEAEQVVKTSLAIFEKTVGPNHPTTAKSLTRLAAIYGCEKRYAEGLTLVRRATQLLSVRFALPFGNSRQSVLSEQRTASETFELHVGLLNRANGDALSSTAESFSVAQLARASDTAEQVANMTARYATGSDSLAQLARARQDAQAQLQRLDALIVQTSSHAAKDRNATREGQVRVEMAEVTKTLLELDVRLDREFPKYRELTNSRPLELEAAQKLLNEGEALILFLIGRYDSYLWVLRQTDSGFFKLDIKRDQLAVAVKSLRSQLDIGAGDPEVILSKPFDVATAHDLYQKLLAPAEKLLVGAKHLIIVPDGALQSLPIGVLVTVPSVKPPATLKEHADVAWLAKKHATTVLPAASSLRALRQFAKLPVSIEPFSGFGAPILDGETSTSRGKAAKSLYSRGSVVDVNEIRKLEPLPEAAGELRAIAVALKAPSSSVHLGAEATERAVKAADLTRYRNLAFATHGLMAGDFKGLAEPALVFTPPILGSTIDDGLLTSGEISQLKLDADWVVLSACNTAAPDGTPGAEGLSGLARAFFYAGARSLLVSHWAVASEATVALTTKMFEESAKGAQKAEALRRSMLELMLSSSNTQYAHPAFWAPFVVVGEGWR